MCNEAFMKVTVFSHLFQMMIYGKKKVSRMSLSVMSSRDSIKSQRTVK